MTEHTCIKHGDTALCPACGEGRVAEAHQFREAERVEFLKACAIASLPFADRVKTHEEADKWPAHVIQIAQKLWGAIEATRSEAIR